MNNSPATTPSWPPSSLCCRSFFSVCTLGSYNPFSTLVRVVKKKKLFIYFGCARRSLLLSLSLVAASGSYSLVLVSKLLTVVASC